MGETGKTQTILYWEKTWTLPNYILYDWEIIERFVSPNELTITDINSRTGRKIVIETPPVLSKSALNKSHGAY